ncbi:receptor-like protein 1 [Vigna umbellata]|uniref:receptor-like protein 1 n=1 Tax=Vigna umbellata TaxID=87088 RepID=UPI001F5E6E1E|nr:receptor-like protein 1 [Vigna umbellata]
MCWNEFKGAVVARDFHDLKNLGSLILDGSSNLENDFFQSIGDLTSLKVLSLFECYINGTLPAVDWFKLNKLEELDLSYNHFEGLLPSSFVNMTSLRTLKLSYNYFIGNFASNLASLTSLEYFGFEENQFEVPISFTPFANHSNLKFIYGDGNKVIMDSLSPLQNWIPKFQLQVLSLSSTTDTNSIPFPKFLLYQYNITSLDFTSCKLDGEFPNWLLKNNTQLEVISVRNCSFSGNFEVPSRPLLKITTIDVSDNFITGQILGSNISSIFPNLIVLNMSINDIQGSIPREFSQMHFLDTLDLSDNNFSREIPKNISTLKYLEELYLDGNSLSGSIDSFSITSLATMDLSNNHLVGNLPSVMGNFSRLTELSLSNNNLGGSISTRFVELNALEYLDISGNNFSGFLPSFANSFVKFVHMSNNRFTGLSKSTFSRSSLMILDLSYNRITSKIQDMILDLENSSLNILILKGNNFSGHIPQHVCQLKELFILDLSSNNLSGLLPSCLGKMPFVDENFKELSLTGDFYSRWGDTYPNVKQKVNFTTKKTSYTYKGDILGYMSGIDLSNNKLTGNIPSEFGNLTRIKALNLSYNDLIGQIPASFSNLVQIESLDLSFNKLSGKIPPQISRLSFVAVFSVAHNNLTGETPERKGQFITFDESSYEGNAFLCGPPLPRSCNPYIQPHAISPNNSHTDGGNCSFIDIFVFWISFGVSCTSTVLVIVAILYINPYWRRRWFYNIEFVCTNCYYFIEDMVLLKFSNKRTYPNVKQKVNFTTKKTSYTYKGDILGYMSGIDLSNNKLTGNIPSEFGNLTRIKALNLSYNDLIGQIPASFSNLVQIESLDLSFNKLSGKIPPQISRLSFVAVFSVAHNNLTGETPERKGQFITFDESSYEGNAFLCGPPLPRSCNPYIQPHAISPNNSHTDGGNCSFIDIFVFWISFGVSCTSTVLVIVAILYINPYWRRRWFYNIEFVCTNCYYFIEDMVLLKFSNKRST